MQLMGHESERQTEVISHLQNNLSTLYCKMFLQNVFDEEETALYLAPGMSRLDVVNILSVTLSVSQASQRGQWQILREIMSTSQQ